MSEETIQIPERERAKQELVDLLTQEKNAGLYYNEAVESMVANIPPVTVERAALVVYWPTLGNNPNKGREIIQTPGEYGDYLENHGTPEAVWDILNCPELGVENVELHGLGHFNGLGTHLEDRGYLNAYSLLWEIYPEREPSSKALAVFRDPEGKWLRLVSDVKYLPEDKRQELKDRNPLEYV